MASWGKAGKYCSLSCSAKANPRIPKTAVPLMKKCVECQIEFNALKHRGKNVATYCSRKCMYDARFPWRSQKVRPNALRTWAKKVKDRNSNRCVECGEKTLLEAHHIFSQKDYPDLRYDLDNGITLCVSCHANKHTDIKNFILHKLNKEVA